MRFTTTQKIRRFLHSVEKAFVRFFQPRWLKNLTKRTSKTIARAESQVARSTRKVTKGVAQSSVGQGAKDVQKAGTQFQKTIILFFSVQWKFLVAIITAVIPKPIRELFTKAGARIAKRFDTLFQFIGRWFKSRTYSLLIGGIPAILLSGVLMYFVVRIPFHGSETKIAQYTGAANKAIKNKDSVAAALYHRRLKQLGGMNQYNVYRSARFALEEGNIKEAHEKIKSLAPLDDESLGFGPAHSQMAIWILFGEIKLPAEEVIPAADAHIKRALLINQDDVMARAARAEILKRTGRLSLAISELEDIGRQVPAISLTVVELYLRQGKVDKAKETLRKVDTYYQQQEDQGSELDPMGFVYWTQTKLMLGEFDEADRIFTKAAEVHGENDDIRRRALDYFGVMAELSKGPTKQSGNRTISYIRQGLKLERDNRSMLRKLVKLSRNDDEAGRLAKKEIDTILQGDDVPKILWSMVGTVAAAKGDFDAALRLMLRGANENPKDAVTLNNAAWVQLQVSQKQTADQRTELTNALKMVDDALAIIPNRSLFHETRGQILLGLNRPTEAVKALETSLNGTERPTPELHEALAKAYAQLNNSGIAEMHRATAQQLRGGKVLQ
ncbi:hypothetical protein ACFL2H_03835 [Planctomycetota bacterium]